MKPWLKWAAAGLIIAALAAGAARTLSARKASQLAFESQQAAQKTQVAIELQASDLIVVKAMDMPISLVISGPVKATQTAMVKARIPGELQGLTVREGDFVRAGQVLARIDPTESEARVRQARQQAQAAKAQVDIAQRAYDNNRALVTQGFISGTALESSQAVLSAAQATYAAAQSGAELTLKALEDTALRAPIAGQIAQRLAQAGERVAVGVFGAGDKGSNYQKSLSAPLSMLQAEKQLRLFGGLLGNYRAYAWTRSQVSELDGVTTGRHTGIGLSIDQRVGDGVNLFARYGNLVKGELPFNQALSIGGEINGAYWGRGADAIGIGGSWLKASAAYRAAGGSGDLDGDGVADFTFTPAGAEKVAEIYYRYRIAPQFEITPDFQLVTRGGANPDARSVKVLGLRANISY